LLYFIPNGDTPETTTETTAFVYTNRPQLGQQNWTKFSGWNWTCGCRSLQGNVFFGDANGNIWFYGNRDDEVFTDFVDLTAMPAVVVGTPITFQWRGVWIDFKAKTNVKNTKTISFDTRGQAEFTAKMYVDEVVSAPALSGQFSGGEQGGFGSGGQPFGGGRNTAYKKKYGWPAKFNIAMFDISGSADAKFGLTSISVSYQLGSDNR
jgi:hypothetical protein